MPKSSQKRTKGPQLEPQGHQNEPNREQWEAKSAPKDPNWSHKGAKMSPKGSKGTPKGTKSDPKINENAPKGRYAKEVEKGGAPGEVLLGSFLDLFLIKKGVQKSMRKLEPKKREKTQKHNQK